MDAQERAFWDAVAADPEDGGVRLAFADWLFDRDDPRGAGMRATAVLGLRPWRNRLGNNQILREWYDGGRRLADPPIDPESDLPRPWFRLLGRGETLPADAVYPHSRLYATLREALDDACLAFAELTPDERAAVLLPSEV